MIVTVVQNGPKLGLSSKLLFISSADTYTFYRFYISQGGAATHLRRGGIRLVTTLLQIVHKMCQRKNFENRTLRDVVVVVAVLSLVYFKLILNRF